MVSKKKLKDCPIVHAQFLDHCQMEGQAEVASIDLFGRLYSEDEKAYYIAVWICDSTLDDNAVTFAVIKHSGVKLTRLVPSRV